MELPVVMRTKLIRLNLFDDIFTIITSRKKEVSVVIELLFSFLFYLFIYIPKYCNQYGKSEIIHTVLLNK